MANSIDNSIDNPEATLCELDMQQLRTALHDLCQPLTTLQCRLEMAVLLGTPEAFHDAVALGIVECGRLTRGISEMRTIVCRARQAAGEAREVAA